MGSATNQRRKTRREVQKSLKEKLRILNRNLRSGGRNAIRISMTPEETREMIRQGKKRAMREEEFNKTKKETQFIKRGDEDKLLRDYGKFLGRLEIERENASKEDRFKEVLMEMAREERLENKLEEIKKNYKEGKLPRRSYEFLKNEVEKELQEIKKRVESKI